MSTSGDAQTQREGWHLDKKVPITIVLSILMQTGGFVWWASSIEQRMQHQEKVGIKVEDLDRRMHAADTLAGRIDERLVGLQKTAERIELVLQGLQGRRP